MDEFAWKYLLTITAAAFSETVTFPLDLTKTRLQIQGELQKTAAYQGMIRTAIGIVRHEGFFKLWKGLQPAILRHAVYSGCRMSFYELLRDYVFLKETSGKYPLWKAIPTGMIAGASAQFLASPTDLIKIRLQAEGKKLLQGKPIRYRGPIDVIRIVVKEDGFLGLWRGWIPNCQRAAIVCLGDLTTYDSAKQFILRNTSLQDTALTHSLASGCSGLVSAVLGTPADVMKTRMMNQPYLSGRGVLYSSTFDCLQKTVKSEGIAALWKGFVPTWSRMAPWSLTFWLVYEEIRVVAGVGNF